MKISKVIFWIICLGLFFALPSTGFALALVDAQTFDYTWSGYGYTFDYADIIVEVYQDSYTGNYSNDINVSLDSGKVIYVYEIINKDIVSSFPQITTFSLQKTENASVESGGSLSGNANFAVEGPNIVISGLSIQTGPSYSDVVYFVSDHAPGQLRESYVIGSLGPSLTTPIIAPNHPVDGTAAPEPATLLLVGSGLIGLAGYRRMRR